MVGACPSGGPSGILLEVWGGTRKVAREGRATVVVEGGGKGKMEKIG